MAEGMNRRKFLKVLGVTGGGAAVLSGCSTDSAEKILPYLVPPETELPGIATYYATTCRECPAGCGMHVRVRQGRAVKVEGNPNAPLNAGRLCGRGQVALQGLYNPDRIRSPLARGPDGTFAEISWDDALQRIAERLNTARGEEIWFLSGNESGTFGELIREWLGAFGSSNHLVYEPFGYEALRFANRRTFGIDAFPQYDFAAARYVISFGTDFLETWLNPVENTKAFTESHAYGEGRMGKFVHVEPRMSMTGVKADEWIAPVPGTEALLALAMAQVILSERLGSSPSDARRLGGPLSDYTPESVADRCGVPAERITRLAREFAAVPSLAVAGGVNGQHDQAHNTAQAVNLLNYVTGNVGRTVKFGPESDPAGGSSFASLVSLADAIKSGNVGVLFIHGANPVYASPRGLGLAGAMGKVGLKVSFARFLDETSALADLILPDHDPLEQWNDFEPRRGVTMLQQPVMQPVFDTRQTGDVLLDLGRRAGKGSGALTSSSYKEYLQRRWRRKQRQAGDARPFDTFWRDALARGGLWTDTPAGRVRLAPTAGTLSGDTWQVQESKLPLILYPNIAVFDGRSANRPWLQELPDPMTKITWNTWVELNPATAARFDVSEGDILELTSEHGTVKAQAYIHPAIRDGVLAMPLGQGHTEYGRYATGRGVNGFDLVSATPTEFGGLGMYVSVTVNNTRVNERFAKTEGRRQQMNRGIAQATTLAAAAAGRIEHFEAQHAAHVPDYIEPVLEEVQEKQHEEYRIKHYAGEHPRWGLAVDLSKCTGCSACVTACNSENNIPFVGPDRVKMGREMHWIRIERYFEESEDGNGPEVRFVPVMCQQCGNAPCEPVCPVFAAYHTPDGLNGQVYNRCVGTRYCSNNCPYKVRYFNWFDYQNPADEAFAWPEPMHWGLNPDVTVRSKGVMEKCTFCVQRIRGAQHQARLEDRELTDGEIRTACQQTCPADAIAFGDLHDPESKVSQLARDERGYHILGSLNTEPGVTYLMNVRNGSEA